MFGMWCIVSAPLVLSFDVTVGEVVDAVWPILSNSEAVSINQRWEGSPGRLLLTDRKGLQEPNAAGFVLFPGQLGQARGWQNVPGDTGPVGWQVGDCVDEWTGGACSEHYMVLKIENMTLGEADAWCGNEPLCDGFSYRNGTTGSAAVDDKVREIYFKGADEVFFMDGCGNSPVASPPWSSHIKESRAPPFAVSPGSDADESTSGVQVWVKEFAQSEPPQIAVLLVNVGQTELPTYSVPLADLPAPFDTAGGDVRDVWARQDLAPIAAGGELLFEAVEPHGSRFLLLTAASSSTAPPAPPLPFNDASLPLSTRLDDLMARLTTAELVAQLGGPSIGSIRRANLTLPGISYGRECLSGVDSITIPENKTGTTAFPNPVNLGMSFDAGLLEAVGTAIGDEARALWNAGLAGNGGLAAGSGGLLCLSPVLNVARDPRWGRSYESYGEDPFAISHLSAAYIRGLQYGPGAAGVTAADNPRNLKKIGSVAKHLSAYNFEGCVGSEIYPHCTLYRESFDARVAEADLQDTYWPAWRRLASELSGAMCSYNAVNGVPACADKVSRASFIRSQSSLPSPSSHLTLPLQKDPTSSVLSPAYY